MKNKSNNSMKEVLMSLLSKLYKMGDAEVAELLEKTDENEILTSILERDRQRVQVFKDQITAEHNKGHQKGKGEALAALENQLREKFGISATDLKGVELVDAIVAEQQKSGGVINDETVKKHPAYLQLEKQLQTKERAITTEWQKKLDAVHGEYKQKEVQGVVRNKALEILDSLNPVLPADATKAAKVKNWFLNDLVTSNHFEVAEDGTILLVDKEGQPLKDEHGYTQKFEDVVKDVATNSLELTVSQARSSAGNGGGTNNTAKGAGSKTKLPIPKFGDTTGLSKILNDSQIPLAERMEVSKAYEAQNAQTV